MKMNKRAILLTTITTVCIVLFFTLIHMAVQKNDKSIVRVAYIYEGDGSTPYTENFMKAQLAVEQEFGNRVETVAFYNVKDVNIDTIYDKLFASDCDLVFATSYGFENTIKQWAKEHPDIQFCQATGDNANVDEQLDNYHNFMGTIYQGRYVAGVVAGAKMKEMIKQGKLSEDDVKIGYVAAFPYAEVISGYTAFYMGVYSQVPSVTMQVIYVNSWSDYAKEKMAAKRMIENGCTIISQHSDTIGSAVACQELKDKYPVVHVGYNGSMIDVAPTTSLISSKINWASYEMNAVEAMLKNKDIESCVVGKSDGNDAWGGFEDGWVELLGVNEFIVADGTNELIEETVERLKKGEIEVFSGPFTGKDPFNPSDTIDLSKTPFLENSARSAPQFHYVLDDVIEVLE
ncbi:MAG: BMP family ABC transporter substrate-binding protein [Eubacteriales bacterium]|nr:BMP family ABC transporter substrate-binding protein [Eubacteriales bacterium]